MGVKLLWRAAFEKLGLDCANWTEPIYADLLRCVCWTIVLDGSLAYVNELNFNLIKPLLVVKYQNVLTLECCKSMCIYLCCLLTMF